MNVHYHSMCKEARCMDCCTATVFDILPLGFYVASHAQTGKDIAHYLSFRVDRLSQALHGYAREADIQMWSYLMHTLLEKTREDIENVEKRDFSPAYFKACPPRFTEYTLNPREYCPNPLTTEDIQELEGALPRIPEFVAIMKPLLEDLSHFEKRWNTKPGNNSWLTLPHERMTDAFCCFANIDQGWGCTIHPKAGTFGLEEEIRGGVCSRFTCSTSNEPPVFTLTNPPREYLTGLANDAQKRMNDR